MATTTTTTQHVVHHVVPNCTKLQALHHVHTLFPLTSRRRGEAAAVVPELFEEELFVLDCTYVEIVWTCSACSD